MEDEHLIELDLPGFPGCTLLAVFDGHGTRRLAPAPVFGLRLRIYLHAAAHPNAMIRTGWRGEIGNSSKPPHVCTCTCMCVVAVRDHPSPMWFL